MTPQSRSKWGPWDLTQFSQLPLVVPSYSLESHYWSEISSLSKVILVLGKARSCRAPHLGCRGLSHLSDSMFYQNTLHETGCRCIVMMKLPITSFIAAGFCIIQIVSVEEYSSFTQNLMQVHCSTHSVILNAMAP